MLVVNLLDGDVATIGSAVPLSAGGRHSGQWHSQLLPRRWYCPGICRTRLYLSWVASPQALLPAAFSMAMLSAIESLLCAVVLDGMTAPSTKPIAADWRGAEQHCTRWQDHYAAGRSAANVRAGATSPVAAVIHALLVIWRCRSSPHCSPGCRCRRGRPAADGVEPPSEAHKIINLLRHAPDDIVVMLMCMSLTVLFDMVDRCQRRDRAASLLFMHRIAR